MSVIVPGRTNWCKNPSFETNTSGWVSGGSTIAQSALAAAAGDNCALIAITSVAGTPYTVQATGGTWGTPVVANDVLHVWSRIRLVGSGIRQVSWQWNFYDVTGVAVGSAIVQATKLSIDNTDWFELFFPNTIVPSTAGIVEARALLRYEISGTLNAGASYFIVGDNIRVDTVDIAKNEDFDTYIDGSLGSVYHWSGTAHASTSYRDDIEEFRGFEWSSLPVITGEGSGGGITASIELYRATIDNELVEDLNDLGVDGNIEMNIDRIIKLNGSFTIPNPGRITPYSDYLAPFLIIEYDDGSPMLRRQLGLFSVQIPPSVFWPDDSVATFSGESLEGVLVRSAYNDYDNVPSGTVIVNEITSTWAEANITRWNVPSSTRTTGYERSYAPGISRYEKTAKLANRMKCHPPFMDLDGRMSLLTKSSKRSTQPYITVGSSDLLTPIQVEPSSNQVYNQVMVIRDNASEPPIWAYAENVDPSSPTSIPNIGPIPRPEPVRLQEIESQADADELVLIYLEQGSSYYRTAQITIYPNANFGFNQNIKLALDEDDTWSELNGLWAVIGWGIGFASNQLILTHKISQITRDFITGDDDG